VNARANLLAPEAATAIHEEAGVLAEIGHNDVFVAIWDRISPVSSEVVALACEQRMAVRTWLDGGSSVVGALQTLIPGAAFAGLREDLALLSEMVGCLFGVSGVGLRVTALEKPLCPRFHVDRIPVRMLCTYGGPGSQWLPADAVSDELLLPGQDQQGHYPENRIEQLLAGQVALFKGDTWQDNDGRGVVHRSPPLSPGQQRLLVTLDI